MRSDIPSELKVHAPFTAFGILKAGLITGSRFLAVWLPCCMSDIVVFLLLAKKPGRLARGKHGPRPFDAYASGKEHTA